MLAIILKESDVTNASETSCEHGAIISLLIIKNTLIKAFSACLNGQRRYLWHQYILW